MNLNAFHKGHAPDGEGDLPLGPSGISDDRGAGRWEEDRTPRDRPSRGGGGGGYDDDGPSRADDGEWRQSGGRRGGGFRGGGDFGDRGRDSGFRSGGDGFRSGGDNFRSGGDRESGFRSGGGGFGGDRGDRSDRFGGDRGDRGGDRGDRFGGDRGDRFGGDRGGDRFGGDRGGDRFGGDRGGDRGERFGGDRGDGRRFGGGFERGGDRAGGGDERWRRSDDRGREEGGSGWRDNGRDSGYGGGREGGFRGGDRDGGRDGGGFRGRDGGSGFSRGESGDVRASSGYKPLQLKKKGESTDGPAEPARRSDMFSGPSPRDARDSRDSRDNRSSGDVRDAVVIHRSGRGDSRDTRDNRDESDRESSTKSVRSPREEVTSPKSEVEKSTLERALEQKDTVSVNDLMEGLETLKITDDNRTVFTETIAKSLFLNKITLKEAVGALEEKAPKDAPVAVLSVLQLLKSKKGEQTLLAMVEHSKLNVLDVIAKGQSPEAAEKLLSSSSLLCLKPASAVEEHVKKALTEGKQSPDEILDYINKNESKQSVSALGEALGTRIGQLIFQDPANPNLEAITQYSKLLKRVVSQPKIDVRGMMAVLYGLQKAWSDAKMPKGSLKNVFEKLYQAKLIAWEGFDAWREDRDNKAASKLKALVQVNSFLDSIKPQEVEEDDEGDEGDDQGEEEE